MDETRISRLLCRSETGRLVLLMAVAVAVILGLQYFELPYRKFFYSSLGSPENTTISRVNESSPAETVSGISRPPSPVHGTESDDVSVPAGNATLQLLASQEKSSSGNITVSSNNSTKSGSEISDSVAPIHRAESDDGHAKFLASEAKPSWSEQGNDTNVLKNSESKNPEERAMFLNNNSTKDTEASGLSRSSGSVTQERKKNKRGLNKPPSVVIPITEMKNLLLKRHNSQNSKAPLWASKADEELRYAKSQIKNAPLIKKDDALYSPLYRNVSVFKRSYELMEKILKVYIYSEGERPIFHQPEAMMDGIYASEGWFMKLMETSKRFVTHDPSKAHLFYLAFSSRVLQQKLYVRDSHSRRNLVKYIKDYVDFIISKYPFWNRTAGSDHFLAACHDWAPAETRGLISNCIRALCNANAGRDFVIGKDISLPTTRISAPENPYKNIGGNRPSKRPILAFFAGNLHGQVRKNLLDEWSSKSDPDMKILSRIDKKSYINYMKQSRFCVCAKGYEVNSPRVVESILYGCVPVMLSDNYVPPFLEVLEWESFAVFLPEKEIPNLKKILLSIPTKRYVEMQKRVLKVQKHFLWHDGEPVRYDLFHMILHSVWYSRVFQSYT